MAAASKWPSWQKIEQIINPNWTFVVKQPTLSCISFQIIILQFFTEVLNSVTTETVTPDTRTFLDSSNLYNRVALAEKQPQTLIKSRCVCLFSQVCPLPSLLKQILISLF